MGSEQRSNAVRRAASLEEWRRIVNDTVHDFGAFSTDGCPRCGAMGEVGVHFCLGSNMLAAQRNPDEPNCPMVGTHLHVFCKCGFFWLTRTKDDPDNKRPLLSPAHMGTTLARYLLSKQRGSEIVLSREQIESHAGTTLRIAPIDGGGARFTIG